MTVIYAYFRPWNLKKFTQGITIPRPTFSTCLQKTPHNEPVSNNPVKKRSFSNVQVAWAWLKSHTLYVQTIIVTNTHVWNGSIQKKNWMEEQILYKPSAQICCFPTTNKATCIVRKGLTHTSKPVTVCKSNELMCWFHKKQSFHFSKCFWEWVAMFDLHFSKLIVSHPRICSGTASLVRS